MESHKEKKVKQTCILWWWENPTECCNMLADILSGGFTDSNNAQYVVRSITQQDTITGDSAGSSLHWFLRILPFSFWATATLGSVSQELAVLDSSSKTAARVGCTRIRAKHTHVQQLAKICSVILLWVTDGKRRDLVCKPPQVRNE